ncbi:MAG: hypothetical protein WCG01_01075 [bacterium]
MKNLIFNDLPQTHEIIIDENVPAFYFCLEPGLNDYVVKFLNDPSVDIESFQLGYGLCDFVRPNDSSWGYGSALKLKKSLDGVDKSWIIWECKIPLTPTSERLDEISATINHLTTAISLFETGETESDINQFLIIDYVTVKSHDYLNNGSFVFTYSGEVLDFAKSIWNNHFSNNSSYMAIINTMVKVYVQLTSSREARLSKADFYVGQYHGELCWPTFRVPGNCACISPDHFTGLEDRGARYAPHNVDTKIQQLSLLAGVVKLANLARENQKIKM